MGAQWLEQSPYALEIRLCLTHSLDSASPPIPFFVLVFPYFGGFSYGGSLHRLHRGPFPGPTSVLANADLSGSEITASAIKGDATIDSLR